MRLEQTLGGTAGSLLKIDYLLSHRWRLQGATGAKNADDIPFTLRFDCNPPGPHQPGNTMRAGNCCRFRIYKGGQVP